MPGYTGSLIATLCLVSAARFTHAQEQSLDELFPQDRVVDVDITLDEEDWDEIRSQRHDFMSALHPSRQHEPIDSPYSYVEGSITIDGTTYPRVGIRKKGFIGSQDSQRPSLKIKLDYIDEEGDIGGLNNLTLNNNKQDRSLMSQFLTYKLFDEAGSPGSRCAFAKVTVNGRNLGIYSHVESMKDPLLEREFGSSEGTLYEGTAVDFYEDWGNSFERKSGNDKRGRRQIEKVIESLRDAQGDVLLGQDAPATAWVPRDDRFDDSWFDPGFDDSAWTQGRGGAGYERDSGYGRMISDAFNFEDEMFDTATSLYIRIPFEVDDLGAVASARNLMLRIKCDDGFVAYLNGHEIARMNAPENVSWSSAATRSVDDRAAMELATFDLDLHRNLLHEGHNVLAIHLMNNSSSSSDLLAVTEIQTSDHDFEQELWELVDEDAFYNFWALEGLLSFWDGYSGNRNNFFIYLHPETGKFHFIPWGTDCLFQTYSPLGIDPASPRSVRVFSLIPNRLYQIPHVRQRYARQMKALMAEHWNEEDLLAETERIEAMITPHLSRSQRYSTDFDSIRDFIRNRRSMVEPEINGEDMPIWNAPPGGPAVIDGDRRDDKDEEGDIWIAARNGDITALKLHVREGKDVDAVSAESGSILGMASLTGQGDAMRFLLDKGADPNIRNNDGNNPLHGAAFLGQVEAVQILIEAGADVNATNLQGETPLMVSAAPWGPEIQGIVEFVGMWLGTDLDMEEVKAGRARSAALLREAIDAGPTSPSSPQTEQAQDLAVAAKSGDVRRLKRLLADGAKPNARTWDITPLSWAVLAGQTTTAELLLEAGADVNGTNQDGSTPLHSAAFLGEVELAKLLLREGANVNARNIRGERPLDSAAAPWSDELRGIVIYIGGLLELQIDLERVKRGRPMVADLLRRRGD